MDSIGWKPLDMLVGGMVTAGVAFGVYKLGANKRGGGTVELDASNLQDCIALAGRPSEMEVSVWPQSDPQTRRLAASLAESIRTSNTTDGAVIRYGPEDVARFSQGDVLAFRQSQVVCRQQHGKDHCKLNDNDVIAHTSERSPPKRRRSFQTDSHTSPLIFQTSPELTRQLQSYRETLDKWSADSEAKLEKIEQQRMALATELHVTREALQAERRHRAEAEQRRHRAEAHITELEARLQRHTETRTEASRQKEEMQRLEQHVQEMEEQLEGLYMHNVVTPRHAVKENVAQQQELSRSLQEAEDEVQRQRQDLQDMENDIENLSEQLNKARKDARKLGEDNAKLEQQLHGAQHAARDMVALLYERSAGNEGKGAAELTQLLNAPDTELPLDKLLQCVTALLLHS
ncbi:differentially expressed in FDCP 6 homolog [Littorina saxatilis]|uniref:Uncharacterized protein n=1 Tax=Littorina saxatilis TaxID=31220 RepID=A0AAN9GJ29_9CAEN